MCYPLIPEFYLVYAWLFGLRYVSPILSKSITTRLSNSAFHWKLSHVQVYSIPSTNGDYIQQTVTIDNEKKIAIIHIHEGACSSDTIFDYKHVSVNLVLSTLTLSVQEHTARIVLLCGSISNKRHPLVFTHHPASSSGPQEILELQVPTFLSGTGSGLEDENSGICRYNPCGGTQAVKLIGGILVECLFSLAFLLSVCLFMHLFKIRGCRGAGA